MFSLTSPFSTTSAAADRVRAPKAIVMINDTKVLWTEASVTTSTFYVADTYHLELPLTGQPKNINFSYWESTQKFTAKIYIGFPSNPIAYTTNDLDLMMLGDADEVEVDPARGVVMLMGRDLTSNFIDTKTTQKFSNNTSSQIATIFANEHGLKPQITTTTTPVGNFYQTQQTLLTNSVTEWDLLTFLAQQEDFVVFVQGDTLIFEPRPTTSSNPYLIKYQAPLTPGQSPIINVYSMKLRKSTSLAGDTTVTVRVPYGTKTGAAFSVKATATHAQQSNISPTSKKQKYSYTISGLTQEQATQKAQQLLRDITRNERILEFSAPGENTLKKDGMVKLTGTGTGFDQLYYTNQVERTINVNGGYDMNVTAKNHAVDSQVSV